MTTRNSGPLAPRDPAVPRANVEAVRQSRVGDVTVEAGEANLSARDGSEIAGVNVSKKAELAKPDADKNGAKWWIEKVVMPIVLLLIAAALSYIGLKK